jgi:hypothetical protein
MTVLLPVFVLAVLCAIAAVYSFYKKRSNRYTDNKQMLQANPFEKVLYIFGAGLGPLYTYMLTVAMAPFRCLKQVDNTFTLVPSPSLDCFDKQWNDNWATIILGLLVVLAIPAFFISVLVKYRNSFNSNTFNFRYAYLISGVKPQFYYWNVFLLFRKASIVMLIDLTNDFDPFLRTFLVAMMLLFFMFVDTMAQPRPEDSSSRVFSLL